MTLTGKISETVALSVPRNSSRGETDVDITSSGSTVRMTLSGSGSPVIPVRLLVRSNSGFRISATIESKTAELTQLSIVNVRATGRLVSPEAIDSLEIPEQFDLRGPFVVLSGPRVSLGGTPESPNNALQVTLLLRVKSQPAERWVIHLTFFNH